MKWLLQTSDFTPHGFCLAFDPELVTWTIIGDAMTAGAYFWISAQLLLLVLQSVRTRERVSLTDRLHMLALFGSFILLCGITHVMHVITLFLPLYWIQALLTLLTGSVSMITAGLLQWVFRPEARALSHDYRAVAQAHDDLLIQLRRLAEGTIGPDQARRILANTRPIASPTS